NRLKDMTGKIDEIGKHYKKAAVLTEKLQTFPVAKKKSKEYRKVRWALGRELVRLSRDVRKLGFTNPERKRLTDRLMKMVEGMRALERQIDGTDRKAEATRNEEQKKELRKQVRTLRSDLERLELEAGATAHDLKRTQRDIIQGD